MGVSPVSIAVNETYEGLGQDVIDCTDHNLFDLTSFNFIEVVSDITLGVPGRLSRRISIPSPTVIRSGMTSGAPQQ
jgi:hypothetical protein